MMTDEGLGHGRRADAGRDHVLEGSRERAERGGHHEVSLVEAPDAAAPRELAT
jgi:hypothetical protein